MQLGNSPDQQWRRRFFCRFGFYERFSFHVSPGDSHRPIPRLIQTIIRSLLVRIFPITLCVTQFIAIVNALHHTLHRTWSPTSQLRPNHQSSHAPVESNTIPGGEDRSERSQIHGLSTCHLIDRIGLASSATLPFSDHATDLIVVPVFCVLCFVFCVLCFVFCVLCFVFCVLCFVSSMSRHPLVVHDNASVVRFRCGHGLSVFFE
jgi:hypothetical protein